MKISQKIKNFLKTAKENREMKRKEKLLIKTDDEELIVDSLPAQQDNSGIDIHKVVGTMQNPENMVEVVKNNLPEIMIQDRVKDTLRKLEDESVVEVIEKGKEELTEQGKIALALQAINDENKRLEVTEKNLEYLTTLETATVLGTVEESQEDKKARKIENKKIKTASEQILRMLVKYGYVNKLDIKEMAYTLKEESSKLAIIKLCLAKIKEYDAVKKRNITTKAKNKMVYDLLKETKIGASEKFQFLKESLLEKKLLTQEEHEGILQIFETEKREKEEREKQQKYNKRPRPKGGKEYE